MMTLRCLANLFFNPASLYIVQAKISFIIENSAHFINSDNKNIRNAFITLCMNYSVIFLDKNDPEGRIQIISALADAVSKENDE